MRARGLEHLLAAHGVGSAKMDGITRKLRECGRLPKGGRGINAPAIGPSEAATILIAVGGSAKANEADLRVAKLEPLISKTGIHGTRTLLEAVTSLLTDPSRLDAISEVRIARTKRRAVFIFRNGEVEEFQPSKPDGRRDRFYVEGILAAPLIQLVAQALGNSDGLTDSTDETSAGHVQPPSRDEGE